MDNLDKRPIPRARKAGTQRLSKSALKTQDTTQMTPMAGRLMLVLGYMKEFQGALDFKELFNSAIDAVLSVTGMDRGYGFLVTHKNDQMSLKEITTRKKGSEFFEEDYTISKSMLKRVLQAKGAVIVDDADTSIESTVSMRDFKIKSVACLPIMLYNKETRVDELRGIIYADKMMSGKMADHAKTTLQMLTELIAINIERCLKFQETEDIKHSYLEFLQTVVNEVNILQENIGIISTHLDQLENPEEIAELAAHVVDQQGRLHEISTSLRQ